jgi:hypothetical protein
VTHTPLTDQQLDEIAGRAAGLYEYATGLDTAWQQEADQLSGTDVPALLAEIRQLHNNPPMRCISCDTPVGWIDAPTGGWWAHAQHPADGHDADPKPASR